MLEAVRLNGKTMLSDNRRLYCLKEDQKDVNCEVLARVSLNVRVNGDLGASGGDTSHYRERKTCLKVPPRISMLQPGPH